MKKLKRNRRGQFMTKDRSIQTKPLPPDRDQFNANRARWADVALNEFQRLTGADTGDAVSDLLADLMHWCCRSGQDFEAELQRAREHYDCETAG